MKKILVVSVVLIAMVALAARKMTQEVLVLASAATEMPRLASSKGFEIQNNGPNNIHCALDLAADAVVDKARTILPDASWSAPIPGTIRVYCIASTADQLTGNGSTFTEAL